MPFTLCGAVEPEVGFVCTEPKGHPGDHIASDDSGRVIKRWPQS